MPNITVAREVVEVELDGFIYKITKLPSKAGAILGYRLMRAVGPALESDEVLDKLFEKLTEAEFLYVLDTFKKETAYSPVDNAAAEFQLVQTFDQHFSGHYGRMVLWLKACLEANYGSFLGEFGLSPETIQAFMENAKAKAMSTASPIASKPSSGPSSTPDGAPTSK